MKNDNRAPWIVMGTFLAALAGCGDGGTTDPVVTPEDGADLQVGSDAVMGDLIVAGDGFSLYIFSKDIPASADLDPVSACQGGCLDAWPAYDAGESPVIDGLNAAAFDRYQRADGSYQTTYLGWPLYRFANDQAAGDLNGEGNGGTWYAAVPKSYDLFMRNDAELGSFLATKDGFTLYVFANDTIGDANSDPVSACEGGCLDTWPAFDLEGTRLPSTLDAADVTTFERPDGGTQAAYRGQPLYLFANDAAPGDTNGHGAGEGAWLVIDPLASE